MLIKGWKVKVVSLLIVTVLVLTACSNNGNQGSNTSTSNSSSGSKSNTEAAASSNFNETGYPIVNEPITMSMMGYKHVIQGPWEDMHFFHEMEKMTNIKFTYDTPAADAYTEAKNLTFTSGNLPDVFFGGNLSTTDEMKYGAQGLLIPLEDLIEKYAPNLTKIFEERPNIKSSITSTDGHIYALPAVQTAESSNHSPLWINGEWLEKLNLKVPETTEEFYQMLKAFKTQDPNQNGQPDEIPLTSDKPGGAKTVAVFDMLLNGYGLLGRDIQAQDGKVFYGVMHPNYKEWLVYMDKLYSEGLIDPDIYTQSGADVTAKGMEGKIGVTLKARPDLAWDIPNQEDIYKYPMTPVLTSEFNSKKMYNKRTGIERGTFAITNKNPNPAAMIRWIDYLYSEEGSIFVHYGPEGMLWEYADKATGIKRYKQPEGLSVEEYRGSITPNVGTGVPKLVRPETEYNWDDASARHRVTEATEKLIPHGVVPYPDVYFTEEEQARLDVLVTDIQTYITQSEAQFVTGQLKVANDYDKFIQTLEKMNIAEVESIHQAAYDRWAAAK